MNVTPLHVVGAKATGPAPATLTENSHCAAFENTRDRRFYYPSDAHEEALSRLLYLAEDGNFCMGMLTGAVGSGKTLLRTLLHSRLDQNRFVSITIENALLGFDGLLLEIISQICSRRYSSAELPDRYSCLAEFKRLLSNEIAGSNRHLVITIDEAQMLDAATLDRVRALTNITAERSNLMSIIFIGQPELETTVTSLPQLDQRIALRYRIEDLGYEEMLRYLEHRLSVAGWRGKMPFTQNTLTELHRLCHGNPRMLNNLLKLAFEQARLNCRLPDDNAVSAVIANQSLDTNHAHRGTGLLP